MGQLKTGVDKAIFLWGVICLVGFGIWQFWQPKDFFGSIHLVWIPLTIVGVGAMYIWVPNAFKNSIVTAWAVITIVGMLISMAMWQKMLTLFSFGINYGVLWALLLAIGFGYTAWKWTKTSRPVFLAATVLCLLLAGVMFLGVKPVAGYQWSFVPLAIASGVPMIYTSAVQK